MARGGPWAGGPAPRDPGTCLAGRYRLEDRLSERDGSSVWRATDEVLARPVAVRTFTPEFRRAGEVVAAARAACRLNDPRLVQIFDADDDPEQPYIVTEWSSGVPLGELLAAGPLWPLRAAETIAEAADALAAAHAAGLAHLCLTPDSLWCDTRGEVKISGLGIMAALTGAQAADPALADTQGLARLLYAAVTGCWPGEQQTTLPPAPRPDGRACDPRQVRAGIPADIDGVICRALFGEADGSGPPILGPAQLSMELASIMHPGPQPLLPAPGRVPALTPRPGPTMPFGPVPTPAAATPVTTTAPLPPAPGMPPAGWRPWDHAAASEPALRAPVKPARRARRSSAAARTLLGLALLAVIAAGGWMLAHGATANHGTTAAHVPATATGQNPRPVGAVSFDPYGDGQGENNQLAPRAIDTDPATAWRSNWYTSARFGNLKPGTGLLLDMGRKVTITGARVTLGSAPGANLQLRVGTAASSLSDLPPVAHLTGAGGQVHLRLIKPAQGRYVLLWFTRLPPDASGTFQASVYNVTLDGR
jgi:hypothetical protein